MRRSGYRGVRTLPHRAAAWQTPAGIRRSATGNSILGATSSSKKQSKGNSPKNSPCSGATDSCVQVSLRQPWISVERAGYRRTGTGTGTRRPAGGVMTDPMIIQTRMAAVAAYCRKDNMLV